MPILIMDDLSFYIFVSFIACVTPGSGVLFTVSNGFRGGLRTVFASPAGTALGVALMTAVSATGLGALIASSPVLYGALQIVSALVLIWLGWNSWQSVSIDLGTVGRKEAAAGVSFNSVFWSAVVLQATNIMLIVFLLSLMPQFISPEDDYVSRVTLLGVLFVVVCFFVHLGYSFIAALGSRWLSGPRFSFWLNRVSAVLFWLLSVSVIWKAFVDGAFG